MDSKRLLFILLILVSAFLVRINNLGTQSLWGDEAYSVALSRQDLPTMIDIALDERSHPPLYQVLLHYWLNLGRQEFFTRALSAYAGVVTVAVVYALGRTLESPRLGGLAAFLLAFSPFHTWYSQETRPYALAILTVAAVNLVFLRALAQNRRREWVLYSILTLAALLTTYLTLLVIIAQFYFLVLGRKRFGLLFRPWIFSTAVPLLIFLPWPLAILGHGGFSAAWIFWIRPAYPADLFWTGYNFAVGQTSNPGEWFNLLGALVFIVLLFWGSYRALRLREGQSTINFLPWWLFLPWLLVFFISLDWPLAEKKSLYLDRFLSPLLPAALLLAGYGLLRLSKVKGLALAGLIIPTLLSLFNLHFDPYYFRDDWRSALATVIENSQDGDVLLVTPHLFPPLTYYSAGEIPWEVLPEFTSRDSGEAGKFFVEELPRRMVKVEHRAPRFWLLVPLDNRDPHGFFQERNRQALEMAMSYPLKAWLDGRYPVLEEWLFQGVHLTLYASTED